MVKLVIGLHHVSQGATKGSSGMVELVCGLYHVSSSGDQGKFLSGRASAWASLRGSKGGGTKGGALL